jgi:hypothetical protein
MRISESPKFYADFRFEEEFQKKSKLETIKKLEYLRDFKENQVRIRKKFGFLLLVQRQKFQGHALFLTDGSTYVKATFLDSNA